MALRLLSLPCSAITWEAATWHSLGASFTEALAQHVEQGGKLSDLNPESG